MRSLGAATAARSGPKQDLAGSNITPEAVIAATDYVAPAIEICGSLIADWNIHIEDTIADNASSGLVVVGDVRRRPALDELAGVAMALPSCAETSRLLA